MWVSNSKPQYIYRYCGADRAAQILRDLMFYFAPVSQLNDLFDFRARSLYTENSESKYRLFAKRLVAERWFSDFQEALEAAKSMSGDDVDDTYAHFLQQLNDYLAKVMKHSGVTCFTSERNNQRMWGQYGGNHAGANIEFSASAEHSCFASHLTPVMYTDSKMPICPSEFATNQMRFDDWLVGMFCCIKHVHWKEECEWRLLLLAASEQTKQDRLYKFERTAITRVFLGPRITQKDEGLIREAAARLVPEVPVFKRKIHDELAQEEPVGFEFIQSFEQMRYWAAQRSTH